MRAQRNYTEIRSRFELETMWGKRGNSLSCLLWRYVPAFYTTKFIQTEIYKKRKVSAMCLIEDLSSKTIKHTNLYNIAHVLGILHSCGRQEVTGITDDVHP